MDLTPGSIFGAYRLEARLGGGSFGSVWRATDTETEQVVALKILAGSYSESEGAQLRTDVELLAAAAAAGSAHVVKVLGGGLEPAPHVVMEFLEGTDLAETLAGHGKLDQTQVIDIGEAVADALAALAHVGVIHRDVKPANIMLGPDGSVKLADFGIAKIVGFDTVTSTGQLPLTMAYAAPEVWDGKASSASDLYALGVVLYQCLTGRLPFTGSYHEIYQAHMSKAPDLDALPPGTTPALRSLIETCMAKEPTARPIDPGAALAELRQARTELDARRGEPGGKPPVAFGPWKLIAAHPTRQWAWGAQHEKTGERAIVEVCFGASAALGETLHRAVEANVALVPLGAERLLGTNRLILRPGEAWPVPPPSGPFAFWVARKELPTPPPATLGEPELRRLVEATETLWATATAAGLRLDLGPSALVALPDGSVHLRRAGLPPDTALDPQAAALDSIRHLPLDLALTATVARAPSLQALGRELGVVDVPTDVPTPEATTLVSTVVIKPSGEESRAPVVAPAPVRSLPAEAGDRRRRRRVAVATGLGAIVVALVAVVAFGAFFPGGAHPSASGSGQLVAADSVAPRSPAAGDTSASSITSAPTVAPRSPAAGDTSASSTTSAPTPVVLPSQTPAPTVRPPQVVTQAPAQPIVTQIPAPAQPIITQSPASAQPIVTQSPAPAPTPPAAPTGVTAVALSTTSIRLAWTDNTGGVASYDVQLWAGSPATWGSLAVLAPGSTSYTAGGLSPGTGYALRIQAVNGAGATNQSDPPYWVDGTTLAADVSVPANAVAGVSAASVSAGQTVTVRATGTWNTGCGNGGPDGICSPRPDEMALLLPSALIGTLVGHIGDGPWFVVGGSARFTADRSGTLVFACNDRIDASGFYYGDNSGSVDAKVLVVGP